MRHNLTRIFHQSGTSRVPLLRQKQCSENFRENTASGEAVAHRGEKCGLIVTVLAFCTTMLVLNPLAIAADDVKSTLKLQMRSRVKDPADSGPFKTVYKTVEWNPKETAIIVCDMWDTLCNKIAADRTAEMAVEMNKLISAARAKGIFIIHAPSGTVDFYEGTPERKLCQQAPKVATKVPLKWNYLNPKREAPLPVDDSDNGWEGPRLPGRPQIRQHPAIEIKEGDAIGCGPDVYYLLEQRGIKNVIMMGVHTNMCVLGRPFGIRQLVYLGKNVALMRDMTDSLYNPKRRPNVSHFRGTELIVEHIEKYWCPTLTSTQFTHKPAFRFKEDKRPHVAMIVSDDHYHADKTLPAFAEKLRAKNDCYVTVLHGEGTSNIPCLEELEKADVMVLFVRRLGMPIEQLGMIRKYLDAGRPMIGMRTANHAFSVKYKRKKDYKPAPGTDEWHTFDSGVLGGNYHGHAGNKLGSDVSIVPERADHPIVAGVTPKKWHSTASLYWVKPIDPKADVLMTATAAEFSEPLVWTRKYKGGRICYVGLGHIDDFKDPQFERLFTNAIFWAMDRRP